MKRATKAKKVIGYFFIVVLVYVGYIIIIMFMFHYVTSVVGWQEDWVLFHHVGG